MAFQIDCTGEPEEIVWPRSTGFAAALSALGVIVAPQITLHTTPKDVKLHDGSWRRLENISMWKLEEESISSPEDVKTSYLYHGQNAFRLTPDQKGLSHAEAAVTASLCAMRCREFLYQHDRHGAPMVQVMGMNGVHPLASLRANDDRWKKRAYDVASVTEQPMEAVTASVHGAHWRKRVFALVAVGFPLAMTHGGVPLRDENGGCFFRDANAFRADLTLSACLRAADVIDANNSRGLFAQASREKVSWTAPELTDLPGYAPGCHLFHFAYQALHCFDQLWAEMARCARTDRSLFMQGQGQRSAILKLNAPDDELEMAVTHTGVKL